MRKKSKVTVEQFTEDHLCCTPTIETLVDFNKTIFKISLYNTI